MSQFVVIHEGSPVEPLLVRSGLGLMFDCHKIEAGHPHYLIVSVTLPKTETQPEHRCDLMIPHRFVALVALEVSERRLGFRDE